VLNRRHLRIKIFHALYAYFQHSKDSLDKGEKELFFSIAKMREMYLLLMLLFVEIGHYAQLRVEEKRKKRLPTEDDLNPNMRFVNNRLIAGLTANASLKAAVEKEKITWSDQRELIKKIFVFISETEEYKDYLESEDDTFENDRSIVVTLFKKHVVNFEPLQNYFDDKSIFWADDLDLASSMTIKTFKMFEEDSGPDQPILDLYKDPTDEKKFVRTLFQKTILQSDENEALIKEKAENWDMERIAMLDMILMKMALTEAREFDQIPVKVTLNEYIEISKFYSTPKSNTFINGILDKLFAEMKENGKIKKIGRGLIEK
jgi:N utilization substance protein B